MPSNPAQDLPRTESVTLLDLGRPLLAHVKELVAAPVLVGVLALGISYLIPPTFTATTTFLPPQQAQTSAASALASLTALSGLAGAAIKTPGDQYVSLLQSVSVTDRLIEKYKLIDVYRVKYRFEARKELGRNVRINLGKKDGLITVEVDDEDPARAADMANQHVAELRRVTGDLALTEAQQRRVFFEAQLAQTRDRLATAQKSLEGSGFSLGALRAEPRAAADGYARLRGELTAAEVRLQALRRGLADTTPEVQQQQATVVALRGQLGKLEANSDTGGDTGYVEKYREFKYHETLFELFSRQYEMARLDESREGALIQVVDPAQVPEWKSRPRRALISIASALAALVALAMWFSLRPLWRRSAGQDATATARTAPQASHTETRPAA